MSCATRFIDFVGAWHWQIRMKWSVNKCTGNRLSHEILGKHLSLCVHYCDIIWWNKTNQISQNQMCQILLFETIHKQTRCSSNMNCKQFYWCWLFLSHEYVIYLIIGIINQRTNFDIYFWFRRPGCYFIIIILLLKYPAEIHAATQSYWVQWMKNKIWDFYFLIINNFGLRDLFLITPDNKHDPFHDFVLLS